MQAPQLVLDTLEGAQAMGHDPRELLEMARFPSSPPPDRVPLVEYARLVGVVARTLDDEYLGLLDRRMPFGTFALQAAYARHGEDLLDVYRRLLEMSRILDLSLVQHLDVGGGEVVHRVRRVPGRIVRNDLAIRMTLVLPHRLVAWMGAGRLPIARVELDYPEPKDADTYRALFGKAAVRYEAESSAFVFSEEHLRRRVRRTEEEARRWGRRTPLDAFLPNVANEGLAFDVARHIERVLLAEQRCPTMAETAGAMGLPPHTLRRRLLAEDEDYLHVRSQAKRDVAIHLLTSTTLSVEEVGFRTGFSAANAFIRAFREWTGVTPRNYRDGRQPG
ncbi:MAG: AraC family transcriptional regulator ligand-binding domain-containing protein [Myxococcota bacterium]